MFHFYLAKIVNDKNEVVIMDRQCKSFEDVALSVEEAKKHYKAMDINSVSKMFKGN